MKKNFICPFCFRESEINELKFRCNNPSCINIQDDEMINYITLGNNSSNMYIEGKPVFPAVVVRNNIPQTGVCPECKRETFVYACPKCHNSIPESTLKGKNYVFSIVGARATGKSHFMAVIINELLSHLCADFNISIEPFDDTMTRYKNEYYNRLYKANQTLDLTAKFAYNVTGGKGKPLVFVLSTKNFLGTINSITIAFYDAAGEDLQQIDDMTISNMNIAKSSGILFLVDPTKTAEIANHIDSHIIELSSGGVDYKDAEMSTNQVLTNMRLLINKYNNFKEGRPIKIPTAIVLSKSDLLENISQIPLSSAVFQDSPNKGVFYQSDCDIVSNEVLGLLNELGAKSFIKSIDTNYKNYKFFAMSALGKGNAPDENGDIKNPVPRRIEDAFLWLMAENGIIKKSFKKVENI